MHKYTLLKEYSEFIQINIHYSLILQHFIICKTNVIIEIMTNIIAYGII